jgi:hypothetical protein
MWFLRGKQRDDDLVRLATFPESCAAHSLRILLEAHGIPATVTDEESSAVLGTFGLFEAGLVGVQVLVKRADYSEAKLIKEEVPAAAEVLIPQWICGCGEEVDCGFSLCWSCGNPYVDSD